MKRAVSGSLVIPLCFSMGCSTSGGGTAGDPGGYSSGNGGSGNGGGYIPSAGAGGLYNPNGGGSANTTGTEKKDAGCAAADNPAQLTQVNILVLLDKSGSMGYQAATSDTSGWDNCADRWNPVVSTLNAFFSQPVSARLYASLSFLPSDGDNTTICKPVSYTTAAGLKVKLTLLDAAGQAKFNSLLCECDSANPPPSGSKCIVPQGGTPTLPALQGTITYMGSLAQTYPDSKSAIVLITDGEPSFYCAGGNGNNTCNDCSDLTNGCTTDPTQCVSPDTEVEMITSVIQNAPKQSIHVVGVGPALTDTTFNAWADASGNGGVDLRSLDGPAAALKLMDTLQSIRTSSIKCDFDVPLPPNNETIETTKTYVYYTPGSGNGYYLQQTSDGTSATCVDDKGWYFDSLIQPKKINLCGTTCDALQKDAKGNLEVNFGCQPHIIVL
jgi:hypothetical protein